MSRNDSKYFSTTKKGEIPELKEELNSQYKVPFPSDPDPFSLFSIRFHFLCVFLPPIPDLYSVFTIRPCVHLLIMQIVDDD